MNEIDVFQRLGVALAVGLLVGLERGWHEREAPDGGRVAGLRTFGLIGLAGGVWALLAATLGAVLLGFGFLAVAGVLVAGHWQAARRDQGGVGITTSVAGLVTFGLGALAVAGDVAAAAAVAAVMTLLLGLKPTLHRWLLAIDERELFAALQLALISLVVLPVLPNHGLGPYGALNPYKLWLMVVLIAGISFAGYVAVRVIGAGKGILLTAFFGGLVSSTAVTLSFSRRAKEDAALAPALGAGVVIASTIMFPRIGVLVWVIQPSLLPHLVAPLAAQALAGGLMGLWLVRQRVTGQGAPEQRLSNPFELKTAVSFGAVLAGILVAARALHDLFGEAGIYALGVISGLADVDAMVVSAGQMAGQGIPATIAAGAILLAAASNTAVKASLVFGIAGRAAATRVVMAFLGILLAGGLTVAVGWVR
ncbi:MAG TPA: MgtC/SapB family protein [Azospirillaceae bacterium]|nr:MgtC/SapB family protein [Azospirillaceae bacterium]